MSLAPFTSRAGIAGAVSSGVGNRLVLELGMERLVLELAIGLVLELAIGLVLQLGMGLELQ